MCSGFLTICSSSLKARIPEEIVMSHATASSDSRYEQRLDEVRRHLEVVGGDVDAEHEIYHLDAVLEFPQSRERFEGRETFREWRGEYPADVRLRPVRIAGDGDVWVGLAEISYEGGAWQPAVAVLEYRGDRVARETIYVTEHFEAPAWRARWRSPWPHE
jgi:hypothetical protein